MKTDYTALGIFPLTFQRYYDSQPRMTAMPNYASVFTRLPDPAGEKVTNNPGATNLQWRSNFDRGLHLKPDNIAAARPQGSILIFQLKNGAWVPDDDVPYRLAAVGSGWELTVEEDLVESYDANGRLVSLRNRQGLTHTLAYNAAGKLESVTDPFEATLTFAYDTPLSRLSTVTLPDGGTLTYTYDTAGNVASVTYPDARQRLFHYNEQNLTSNTNLPIALTGITDEKNVRFANFGYRSDGRAILTELTGGVDAYAVSYGSRSATVTDAFGQARTYAFTGILGVPLNTDISGPLCPTCGPAARTYDARGYVASSTDWNGNRTNYTHDARGLETSRVEGLTSGGATTAVTRTITAEWHADYRLPLRIAEPLRRTTLTYGAPNDSNPGNRGNVLTRTIQATDDPIGGNAFTSKLIGAARTWTYTYNTEGQVLTLRGPRTDISTDVTTFAYYANNASCAAGIPGPPTVGCRGKVNTIANGLNHVTTIDEYSGNGQPLKITDPNGMVTTLGYDARMRLTSRTVDGLTTTYEYEPTGLLKKVTAPDASFIEYLYDAAHRLTEIRDNLANRIVYTLDVMGNRTVDNTYDDGGVLRQTHARTISALNRLVEDIGAVATEKFLYAYDAQGNLKTIDGPLSGTADLTTNDYDELNRLKKVTDALSGSIQYEYDGLDQLTKVTDPRKLETTYTIDGLGNLTQLASPDTGTTSSTYDAAGNLLTATDAKSQVTTYAYDALNRVTSITYQGGVQHTFTYDQGTNQKGRLTQISEPSSTTTYGYDLQGRLTSEARTIAGVTYTTGYAYDAQGQLNAVTYPSGRQLTYTFDALGRVRRITSTQAGTTQTVVSAVSYMPFGGVRSFAYGNGRFYNRGFDLDGRVASYTLTSQTFAVGYDPASRIQTIVENGVPANTNTYGYDLLDRLTSYSGASPSQAFTYDAVGNRSTKTVGAATSNYSYPSTSNRLSTITGAESRTYTHDAVGSITADGTRTFGYDTRGRMTQSVGSAGTTNYSINAVGQRVRKANASEDTVYHYDAQGRLIAESTAAGAVQKEYIYLGDIPVAIVQ